MCLSQKSLSLDRFCLPHFLLYSVYVLLSSLEVGYGNIQILLFFYVFQRLNTSLTKFDCNSGQHVELHNPNPPPDCVGYIHTKMSPMEVAQSASEDARAICLREYGSAPNIKIYGDPNFTFP